MNKIGMDLLTGTFSKNPHDVYITYDELTDELIVRVIDPKRLTYLHEIENNDRFAFLVENDSDEVVGFQLFNFEKECLQTPNWAGTKKVWSEMKKFCSPGGYKKFLYDPKKGLKPRDDFSSQGNYIIQEVLTSC